jgi:small-conductance mechanosensitive channel
VSDYAAYMDAQQAINLGIMRAFAAREIEFAYPTQTLFVERES